MAAGGGRATLEQIGDLDLTSLGALVSAVTDGAVAPDGRRVAFAALQNGHAEHFTAFPAGQNDLSRVVLHAGFVVGAAGLAVGVAGLAVGFAVGCAGFQPRRDRPSTPTALVPCLAIAPGAVEKRCG